MTLNEDQRAALEHHFQLLLKWNAQMNLTAIREPEEIRERHFAESLDLARYVPPNVKTILDVGSGGGFPGLPIAIALPQVHVTLLDSHTRKCVFLREASRQLKNVKVLNQRLESTSGQFDLITARGVAWDHMFKWLPKLSHELLLLSTDEEWINIQKNKSWLWQEPIQMPSGDKRKILRATRPLDLVVEK